MFYCKCLLVLVTLSTIAARSHSKKHHTLALKDPNHRQYVFSPLQQRNPTNPSDDNLRPFDTIIHFEKPKSKKKIRKDDDVFGEKGYVYITQPKEQDDEIYDLRTQNHQDPRSFEDVGLQVFRRGGSMEAVTPKHIDTSLTPDWREKEWGPMPYNNDCCCRELHRPYLISPAQKQGNWKNKCLRHREQMAAIDAGNLPKGRLRGGKAALSEIKMRDLDEPFYGPAYRKSDSIELDFDEQFENGNYNDNLFKNGPFAISANPDKNSINNFIKVLWKLGRNVDNDQPKYQEPIHDAEIKITFEPEPGVGRAGETDSLVLPIP